MRRKYWHFHDSFSSHVIALNSLDMRFIPVMTLGSLYHFSSWSDDDLVPYDMSNDKVVTDSKPPKYVRDCMEGKIFLHSFDMKWFESHVFLFFFL